MPDLRAINHHLQERIKRERLSRESLDNGPAAVSLCPDRKMTKHFKGRHPFEIEE